MATYLPKNAEALELYKKLQLAAHPECTGWFVEVYRSSLPVLRSEETRTALSSIHFLHDGARPGHWRELKSDELFVWQQGSSLQISIISPDGHLKELVIGNILTDSRAHEYQVAMPANHVFATRVLDSSSYTLTACVVAPAWTMDDFKSCDEAEMLARFPQHAE
uniref:DUF985 domain-containing protein n=1 Tax=Plectus sambesii TaxID=2011161 RepID=A0A914VFR7_9BILA